MIGTDRTRLSDTQHAHDVDAPQEQIPTQHIEVKRTAEGEAIERAILQAIEGVNTAHPPRRALPKPAGVLAYVASAIADDILSFTPPEERASRIAAFKSALAAYIPRRRSKDERLERGMLAAAHRPAGKIGPHPAPEEPALSRSELHALRGLIEGPISELLGMPRGPTTLSEFRGYLEGPWLGRRLAQRVDEPSVTAAIDVTKTVVEQLGRYFDVAVLDKRELANVSDDRGNIDSEKIKTLAPSFQILLQDPALRPQIVSELRQGGVLSAQLAVHTPEHLLEGMREYSRILAGGSFVWVEEFARTGRRPTYSRGDVERMRTSFTATAQGVEALVEKAAVEFAASGIDKALATAIMDAFKTPSTEERIAHLQVTLDSLSTRHPGEDGAVSVLLCRTKLEKYIGALNLAENIRSRSPEALLQGIGKHLCNFDAFREEGLRVRVHGNGTPGSHKLAHAIKEHDRIREYGDRVLTATVTHDYAHEAAKSAKRIVLAVAVLSVVGIPIQSYLGDGMMHMLLATAEDLLSEFGEVRSLTDQGVPLWDVFFPPKSKIPTRGIGLAITGGIATFAAHEAHTLVHHGVGWAGGAALGVGATALTAYTTVASYWLFKRIGRRLVHEAKLDPVDPKTVAKKMLKDTAPLVAIMMEKENPSADLRSIRSELGAAFHRAYAEGKKIPSGEDLARMLASRKRIAWTPGALGVLVADYNKGLQAFPALKLTDHLRATLSHVAESALSAIDTHAPNAPPHDEVLSSLESAFDHLTATVQGLPNGEQLASVLRARAPAWATEEVLAEVCKTQDTEIDLLVSGLDAEAAFAEIAKEVAGTFEASLGEKGLKIEDRAKLEAQIHAKLQALEHQHDFDPASIARVVSEVFTNTVKAANGGVLPEGLAEEVASATELLTKQGRELFDKLEAELTPEFAKVAKDFAFHQVFANPVRLNLALGIIASLAVNTALGMFLPALIFWPVVVATAASTESVFTAIKLKFDEASHRKKITAIGEELARTPTVLEIEEPHPGALPDPLGA